MPGKIKRVVNGVATGANTPKQANGTDQDTVVAQPPNDIGGVGARMRKYRESEGMTLNNLACTTGLSAGFLSQVERGLSSIALSSLHEVAEALGKSLADFFVEEMEAQPVPAADDQVIFTLTRAADRISRIVSGGRQYELLSARAPGLVLEPMLVYIEPGGAREPATVHDGEEFAYVLRGELLYEVAGVEHRLTPGDSIYLRSTTPHTMYNDGKETAMVVSVVTPRHY